MNPTAAPVEQEAAGETSEPQETRRKPGDYGSKQDVRWCPGCGDYAVLSQVKKTLANLNQDPDKAVFVSGIGCSSRFPYYMGTYGIHGIHGRALPIATGLKIARPDLSVWVAAGDGDAMSIGGNHLIHAIRRNVDLNIILFNNRIYGLTKGQASPTSELGKRTVSSPFGTIEAPLGPVSFAIGCEATFVARTVDMNPRHLEQTLMRAAQHRGVSFVEVYQNCNIFNDGAFEHATDRKTRDEHVLTLEHGKPLVFGKERNKGIMLGRNFHPIVATIGENGVTEDDLAVHDEKAPEPALAFLLSRLRYPEYPEPIGVFRDIEAPTFDSMINEQIAQVKKKNGKAELQSILTGADTWKVE